MPRRSSAIGIHFGVVALLLLRLLVVCCWVVVPVGGSEEINEPTTIDACAAAHHEASENQQTLKIYPADSIQARNNNTSDRVMIVVAFTNCVLPKDMRILVALPPNRRLDEHLHLVKIEVVNTTMEGGSFNILTDTRTKVPATNSDRFKIGSINVSVDGSVFKDVKDVLSVSTTLSGVDVEDVIMAFRSTSITSASSAGSITTATGGIVTNVLLMIGGNTAIDVTHGSALAVSIVSSRVVNSSLILDSSECLGPVSVAAGTESLTGHVGVLSIFPANNPTTASLAINNVRILVTDYSTIRAHNRCDPKKLSVTIAAKVGEGIASTASICLRHRMNAWLTMSGAVSIDVRFSGVIGSMPTMMVRYSLLASVRTTNWGVAAVGGVAALTLARNTEPQSNVTLALDGCALRLSMVAKYSHVLLATEAQLGSATITGLIAYSYCQNQKAYATFSLTTESTVDIITSIGNNSRVNALSQGTAYSTSSVFGIAVYSISVQLTTILLNVTENSHITLASTISDSTDVDLQATSDGSSAAVVLGVAVYSHSLRVDSLTTVTFSQHSSLSIAQEVARAEHAVIVSRSKTPSTSVTLGIGVISWASKEPSVSFVASSGANISILVNVRSSLITIQSVAGDVAASTSMGIAILSLRRTTSIGVASVTFQVDAALTIHAVLLDGAVVNATVTNQEETAVSVLGVSCVGGQRCVVRLVGEEPEINICTTASKQAQLSTTGSSTLSAAVGLAAITMSGLSNANTAISFCSDGSVTPTSLGGVAVGVKTFGAVVNVKPTRMNELSECTSQTAVIEQQVLNAIGAVWEQRSWSRWWQQDEAEKRPPPSTGTRTSTHSNPTPTNPTPTGSVVPTPTKDITASLSALATRTLVMETPIPNTTPITTPTTDAATPEPTSPPPQPPSQTPEPSTNGTTPPAPKKKVSVAASILLEENEEAATVILSSAGASSAIASTLGSGGGGAMVVAGSSVRMMECGLTEDEPRPATFELPIQFPIGSGTMRYFGGAAVAHTLLQGTLLAIPMFLRRGSGQSTTKPSSKAVRYLSMFFCGAHAFFTPAILGACSTVLNNRRNHGGGDENEDMVTVVVSATSALVIVSLHAAVVLAIHRGPQNGLITRRYNQRTVPPPPAVVGWALRSLSFLCRKQQQVVPRNPTTMNVTATAIAIAAVVLTMTTTMTRRHAGAEGGG